MTHTADAEPRLPHDYATPPAAPVLEYHLTPEEAARYPAVHPTQADFHDAAEAGWTPDRFAATYGRDAKHTEVLRRAFRSVLDARDMRRRRGEDEDERPPVERSGPAVTTSEWIVRIKAVLRERPDWSRRQVAEALGTTTGTINNALVRCGTNLTELRARVQRELADNAAETVDKNTEVDDVANRTDLNLTTEAIKQVLTEHRNWTGAQIAAEFGLTHKQFENWCTRNNISLREIRKQILLSAFAAQRQPAAPASEPPPTAPDLAEPPPQPADVPPSAPDGVGPTCPICSRLVADCNYHGDCERSGRHGAEHEPIDVELSVTRVTRETCAECRSEIQYHGGRLHCPVCDAPGASPRNPMAIKFTPALMDKLDSLLKAAGPLASGGICASCVKSDVCRHRVTLTDWFERAQLPDVDLDIELDIIVRRCEAYRGEGAA